MVTNDSKPGGLTLALFAMAVVVGGANFIGVRFSNRELDPFWGAALRFTIAASLFLIIAAALKLPWPRRRHLWLNVVYGLLSFSLSYALMYWALVQVSAGVATVVLAIVPLVTLLLAASQGMEKLGIRSVIGSLLAIVGIIWMSLGPQDVVLPFTALLAMLLAALSMGESVIIGKKLSGYHPAITNAVGMTAGAIMLLALSAAVGDEWVVPSQPEVIWSVIYLVTIGSVGLFVLVILVVRQRTASATSYVFVLFPIVTMLLGAWIADEPITGQGVTGALLVMSGVWFGALSPKARLGSNSTSDRPHHHTPRHVF
ncbi:MAG: EamA family transporter [Acidimicrobiales bacterium]|nr:EamA family transporter [Acidimicrobiales bacterium]